MSSQRAELSGVRSMRQGGGPRGTNARRGQETEAAKYRVAYVVYNFETGGIERCVAQFANHLDRSRFQPFVICLGHSGKAADWITVGDVPIVELHKRPGNDWRIVPRLAKQLRNESIQLVHSHNWGTLVESVLACRLAGGGVHLHAEHGQELDAMKCRGIKRGLRGAAKRWAYERVDAVVACADSVRERMHRECGFPARRIHVLPNGVEAPAGDASADAAERLRKELCIGKGSIVIGSVSRLAPVKNFPAAVDAVAALCRAGADLRLVLVGDGPERADLWRRVAALGLQDRVHLVGERQNVGDWLRLFDIYVNCSYSEAMSMSILEAMAAGLPVVLTDVGDHRVLLGDDEDACGIAVPSGDVAALTCALQQLVEHPRQRTEMGKRAARRHGRQYCVRHVVDRYQALYERLCVRRPAKR